MDRKITLGQIGLGYWGPNLLRNFVALPASRVKWCCDLNEGALQRAQALYPDVRGTVCYQDLLVDPEVEAVVIAAPAAAHYKLAEAALRAGKHVFVEKPICLRVADAHELIRLAEENGRILMVGHLLEYHPAVRQLKAYVDQGELGRIYYLYSSRLNLGRVRKDENAMWSLAPHDISVALYLLGETPEEVSAQGMAYLQSGIEDTVFLTMRFPRGELAHCHVSWLDPNKVRRITVVGDAKMAVFDDVESTEKLRLYDKGVTPLQYSSYGEAMTLRFGDIHIPHVEMQEPLKLECQHFLECIRAGRSPLSDGYDGLRVLQVLEAGQRSLESAGQFVSLEEGA